MGQNGMGTTQAQQRVRQFDREPEQTTENRGLKQARKILLHLAVALFLGAWANAAAAGTITHSHNRAHTYTLAQLINDESVFSSREQNVIFSDFTLLSTDVDESLLELYKVVPSRYGFFLYSPDFKDTDPGGISFSYQAEAAEGLEVAGAGLALKRMEEAEMNATGEMWMRNISGDLVGELNVAIQNRLIRKSITRAPNSRRSNTDWTSIEGTSVLRISEALNSEAPPVNFKLNRKFFTQPVPEPTTALLLGLGIVGLAARQRLRSS